MDVLPEEEKEISLNFMMDKIGKLKITRKELWLAIAFFVLWFVFSSDSWILFLDSLTPFKGLLVYYVIIFISMFVLSKLGLIILNIKVKNFWQVLGTTIIFFCFFVIFNFENPNVQYISRGNFDQCSQVFFQSEDGVLWNFWSGITSDITKIKLLIGISIFVLVLFATSLIEKKVKFDVT